MAKRKLLVSSCLLGTPCRYDGKSKPSSALSELIRKHDQDVEIIPVCPEVQGGLPCPRAPCEIKKGTSKVIDSNGIDRTQNYLTGAQQALKESQSQGISVAILKENSPSCGSEFIYDGTFQGKKIKGSGITTTLLRHNGVSVFNEDQVKEAFEKLLQKKE